jgi:hypothetical protein
VEQVPHRRSLADNFYGLAEIAGGRLTDIG